MKNKEMEPETIARISSYVKTAHENFLKMVGELPDKANADIVLHLQRMKAKVKLILNMFVSNGVVDSIVEHDYSIMADCGIYVEFNLIKKGYKQSVKIIVTDDSISMQAPSHQLSYNVMGEGILMTGIDINNFDWLKFTADLLDLIHKNIYNRRFAMEYKIFHN